MAQRYPRPTADHDDLTWFVRPGYSTNKGVNVVARTPEEAAAIVCGNPRLNSGETWGDVHPADVDPRGMTPVYEFDEEG